MFGPFKDLNVGVNPRRHPGAATLLGVLFGVTTAATSLIALLTAAPVRDDWQLDRYLTSAELLRQVWEEPLGDPLRNRLLLALGIGVLAGGYTGRRAFIETPPTEPFTQPDDADPKIHRFEFAETELTKQFAKEAGPNPRPGLWLAPHVMLPRSLETRNIMILGAQGSGKSNLCRALAQNAIERGDYVILHCNKGDVARAFNMKDVILISPTHESGWVWDIGADIDGPAAAAEFAKDIIAASEPPFWSDTGRLILTDVIMALMAERGTGWTARDLLLTVLGAPDEIRERIEKLDLSAGALLATSDPDGSSKMIESILGTITTGALTTLRPMAFAWEGAPLEKRFSVKQTFSASWKGPKTIIVQTHPGFRQLSTSVCGGVLRRICQEITSPQVRRGQDFRAVMVLDEFRSLGRIDDIDQSLSVAREKGLATIVALQSVWQLQDIYPRTYKTLSDLFQIKIYGRHVAGEGAEDAAKRLGSRKIHATKINRHPKAGDKRRYVAEDCERAIFSSHQLQSKVGLFEPETPQEHISGLVHYAGTAHFLNWPPTKWQAASDGYVPAPWTQIIKLAPDASTS